MQNVVDLYLAWGGPNVIAALAAGSVVWFLTTIGKERQLQHYFFAIGVGVLAIIAISIIAAVLGIAPVLPDGALGVLAGIVGPILFRPKA